MTCLDGSKHETQNVKQFSCGELTITVLFVSCPKPLKTIAIFQKERHISPSY